jgi:hypothetical protein
MFRNGPLADACSWQAGSRATCGKNILVEHRCIKFLFLLFSLLTCGCGNIHSTETPQSTGVVARLGAWITWVLLI